MTDTYGTGRTTTTAHCVSPAFAWESAGPLPGSIGDVPVPSPALARELTCTFRDFVRDRPAAVLEVAPGAGIVSRHIAAAMGPEDTLDIVESSPRFGRLMEYQLATDAELSRIRSRTRLRVGPVHDADLATYDVVVCALPFADYEPDVAEAVLEQLFGALRPDGRLSFFAYAGAAPFRRVVATRAQRDRMSVTRRIVDGFIAQYGVRRKLVVSNLPPAWVHHLSAEPTRLAAPRAAEDSVEVPWIRKRALRRRLRAS